MRIEIAVKDYIFIIKSVYQYNTGMRFFININNSRNIAHIQVLRLIFPQQLDGIAFLMRTCQRSN